MTFLNESPPPSSSFDVWFSYNFHSSYSSSASDGLRFLKELGRDAAEFITMAKEEEYPPIVLAKLARILSPVDFETVACSFFTAATQSRVLSKIFGMASSRYYEQTKWVTALLSFIIQSRVFNDDDDKENSAVKCISLLSAKTICLSKRIAPKLADKQFLSQTLLGKVSRETFLSKILKDVWCDPVFIKHEKAYHHSTLTEWILILLDAMDKDSIDNLTVPIDFYNAMTLYLDHWNEEIRVGTMFIAERLSPFLATSNKEKLLFDGFESHPVYAKWANFITTADQDDVQDGGGENVKSLVDNVLDIKSSFDSDDDDSLLPDIPSLEISSSKDDVIYIRDAMALLKRSLEDDRSGGNNGKSSNEDDWLEKRDRALIKLKDLIQGCGEIALRDIALDLTNILLHLDPSTFSLAGLSNNDGDGDASQLRHDCISLLMYKCPDLVAVYLYGEFFSDRVNLGQRLDFMRFWIPGTLSIDAACVRCGDNDGDWGESGKVVDGTVSNTASSGKIIRMSHSLMKQQSATNLQSSSWTSRSIPFLVLPC